MHLGEMGHLLPYHTYCGQIVSKEKWMGLPAVMESIMFMFSAPNPYVAILTPSMTVLGSGAYGRKLGHEGGALVNATSALLKGSTESSLALFLPCRNKMRSRHSAP